jgi:transcriptional regulator with XRE-family HTH domain
MIALRAIGSTMAGLRTILAANLRKHRRTLGISQAALAEKADISTNYVAMIELERKFPSPEMLERLAAALEIEPQELFDMPPSPAGELYTLGEAVLGDLREQLGIAVNRAVEETVRKVAAEHLKKLEKGVLSRGGPRPPGDGG